MKTKIEIDDKFGLKLPLKRDISKIVNYLFEIDEIKKKSALRDFSFKTLSFDIILTDDIEIQSINKEYREKDAPTDVITFALFADDDNKFVFDDEINLGEIIISVETAKRQAKSDLRQEILTLITHGILHLLGFDHLTEADYNFVVGIQDSVILRL